MIVVTGGAGFIGSAFIWKLNTLGIDNILIVDQLKTEQKWKNLVKRNFSVFVSKNDFLNFISNPNASYNELKRFGFPESEKFEAVFHMGACSNTTETNVDFLLENNVHYSIALSNFCAQHKIPFIYASSAATYGMGEHGYSDELETISRLNPINPYGYSKHLFDMWLLKQKKRPSFWAGLKFFNVYGPQEYHKGFQASVIFHAYPQVKNTNSLRLFKSYKNDFKNGEQKRDFIYVKDVVEILWHFYQNRQSIEPSIYNVGTGKARTFCDLGNSVFKALGKSESRFEWIEMPEKIKNQYQYFTEANLAKLREKAKYIKPFTSLEDGVSDYVKNYLLSDDGYL